MNRERTIRRIAITLIASLLLSVVAVIPAAEPVNAASVKKSFKFVYYPKQKSQNTYDIPVSSSEEITDVKLISNTEPSVAKFKAVNDYDTIGYVKLLKPGKTVVTVEITTQEYDEDGDLCDIKEQRTFTVNSIKYRNPVKKLKVGKKSYKSKFKYKDSYQCKKSKKVRNKKLVIKPAKGWKIKSIRLEYAAGDGVGEKSLKNKKRFSSPKNGEIIIKMYNKKLGIKEELFLGL